METEEIKDQFEQILTELKKKADLPIESIVQVAQVILQESGKDRRAEMLQKTRFNGNDNGNHDSLATPKQKNALMRFGIKFNNDITKSEASELLDDAFAGR